MYIYIYIHELVPVFSSSRCEFSSFFHGPLGHTMCSPEDENNSISMATSSAMFDRYIQWIGLRDNRNRKALYLMGKSMVSGFNFPLNQSIDISNYPAFIQKKLQRPSNCRCITFQTKQHHVQDPI
jgi:hypothetical protein